jgi:glycosyltransferase involved in cell wall biosynthesis
MLKDEALYNQLREACRTAAVELTWEREEEQLLKVYRSAVRSDF